MQCVVIFSHVQAQNQKPKTMFKLMKNCFAKISLAEISGTPPQRKIVQKRVQISVLGPKIPVLLAELVATPPNRKSFCQKKLSGIRGSTPPLTKKIR